MYWRDLGHAMPENNDAEQVRDGSTSDENVELSAGSGVVVDGGEVSVSVEPAAHNQVLLCLS